eukprot:1719155-Pyramimonas_sp.AAC.1
MLRAWFRYFGPPGCIKFDQEGGVRSDDFGAVCDRYSIHRQVGGSDDSGKHAVTGLAERHIGLIKTSALKCKASVAKQGLVVEDDDIVFECTMCQNFLLEYGGYTPSQCLQGQNPRGFFDLGTNSTLAIDGARDTTPDTFETYLRLRMMAKTAVQTAVIGQRIAEAKNTKIQILSDVAGFQPEGECGDRQASVHAVHRSTQACATTSSQI